VTHSNILLSSAGRRVGLLGCIRESLERRGLASEIFTIDSGLSAPAQFVGSGAHRVPRCTAPAFVETVRTICADNQVALVIPTIDTELPVYAAEAPQFSAAGTSIAISKPSTVEICCDKRATHQWLVDNGFPTVRQTDVKTALTRRAEWPLPLIAKPYNGSASNGIRHIRAERDLALLADSGDDYIVQQLATGREYTINVYVDRSGRCICAVPHWRMEVRAGEVSKGVTVKDQRLIDLGRKISEALPGAYGALNIQCFMDEAQNIRVIEMNARFGGGYPLAHRAGATFTEWLLDELEGKRLSPFDEWTDDLAMLRYDEAVFVSGSSIRA
jgi:carbamoyl-phosphate synthase large subunit